MSTSKLLALVSAALLSAMAVLFMFSKQSWEQETETLQLADSLITEECNEEFGIDLEGYHVEKGKIRNNQFHK